MKLVKEEWDGIEVALLIWGGMPDFFNFISKRKMWDCEDDQTAVE